MLLLHIYKSWGMQIQLWRAIRFPVTKQCWGNQFRSPALLERDLSGRERLWNIQTGQAAQGISSYKKSWLRQFDDFCFGNTQCRETCRIWPLSSVFPLRLIPHTLPAGKRGSNAAAIFQPLLQALVHALQKALQLWLWERQKAGGSFKMRWYHKSSRMM